MTEAEWLREELRLRFMLEALLGPGKVQRTKLGKRKLRLFACACCRAVWRDLTGPERRRAVEIAEMVAVGEADKEDLLTEWKALTPPQDLHDDPDVTYEELMAAYMVDALLIPNAASAAHGMEFVYSTKEAETVHL